VAFASRPTFLGFGIENRWLGHPLFAPFAPVRLLDLDFLLKITEETEGWRTELLALSLRFY
jgi:hypothetical protein